MLERIDRLARQLLDYAPGTANVAARVGQVKRTQRTPAPRVPWGGIVARKHEGGAWKEEDRGWRMEDGKAASPAATAPGAVGIKPYAAQAPGLLVR